MFITLNDTLKVQNFIFLPLNGNPKILGFHVQNFKKAILKY